MSDRIAIIIPARYASTRFPGKPLAVIDGKTVIRRTWEQARQAADHVYVATDDDRIRNEVENFGEVIMTQSDHLSGTDRIMEAYASLDEQFDYIINVQGDEPLIEPAQIRELMDVLDGTVEIATQAVRIHDTEEVSDPNIVKVVFSTGGDALYFSRSGIPFERNRGRRKCWKHIGIYAYRTDILEKITSLEESDLEFTESLEQLRWLDYGFRIRVVPTEHVSQGIDHPSDIEKAPAILASS